MCIIIIFSIIGPISSSISRGLTEENTQLDIISPIWYFQSQTGDILDDGGLVICSLTLLFRTHESKIPNWLYFPQWEFEIPNW